VKYVTRETDNKQIIFLFKAVVLSRERLPLGGVNKFPKGELLRVLKHGKFDQ